MYLKKDYYESEKIFYNHWIFKISNFQIFSFPFLKFIDFKITTNSFIYSSVEQFFETHFHKNNYRGKVYTFGKNLVNFFGLIYPLTWGVGVYYTSNKIFTLWFVSDRIKLFLKDTQIMIDLNWVVQLNPIVQFSLSNHKLLYLVKQLCPEQLHPVSFNQVGLIHPVSNQIDSGHKVERLNKKGTRLVI